MNEQQENKNYIKEENSSLQPDLQKTNDTKQNKIPLAIKIAVVLMILSGSFLSLYFWEEAGNFYLPMFFITIATIFLALFIFSKKIWAWHICVANILVWSICCFFTACLDFYCYINLRLPNNISFGNYIAKVGLSKLLEPIGIFVIFFLIMNFLPLLLLLVGRKKYFERFSDNDKMINKKIFIIVYPLMLVVFLVLIYCWSFYKSNGINEPLTPEQKAQKNFYEVYEPTLEKQNKIIKGEVDPLIDKKNIVDTEEKKEELRKSAKLYGKQIEILDGITFTNDVGGFVCSTSSVGHAFGEKSWERSGDKAFMHLDTRGLKEAVVQTNIEIPPEANYMRFNYKYILADGNGVLETFLKDVPVSRLFSEDYSNSTLTNYIDSSKTWACSNWIPLEFSEFSNEIPSGIFKGQKIPLVFRLTNLNTDEKYQALQIDDIYFVKISL